MKLSKLLQILLFGASLMKMGIVEGEGGGGNGNEGGDDAAAKAAAETAAAKAAEEAAAAAAAGKKPTDEEARLLKEVMQKKDALKATNEKLAEANEKLKQFEGIDPVAIKKLLEDQKAAETAQLEAKGEWDRLKARMADEHTATTKTLQEQIAQLQAELNKRDGTINELSVGSTFSQSQFISEELTLTPSKARVVYGDHFELEDGKVVGYDKPRGAANRTALVDATGNPVSFDEALRKIVEADPDKDHLLKSKVKPGAGSESKPKADLKNQPKVPVDSISKIGAGLKGLNLNAGKAL